MKVILLNNVPKLGRKFDIKEVSPGFARNYLIPRKLANLATDKNVAALELQKSLHDEKLNIEAAELIKRLDEIKKVTLTIAAKANEEGHLYAGLHPDEISEHFKKDAETDIDPRYIVLEQPIKEVGEHEITIQVEDRKVQCKVVVEAA